MIQLEAHNVTIKVNWIGTAEELELHEWCHSKRGRSDAPLVRRGKQKSKSPNHQTLDNAETSVRYCLHCQTKTVFIHKIGSPHSKCQVCGYAYGFRNWLAHDIKKTVYQMRQNENYRQKKLPHQRTSRRG